jgi:Spy/CpxP family protein refolding chaperone
VKHIIARHGLLRSLRAATCVAGAAALLASAGCSDSSDPITEPDGSVDTSGDTVPSKSEIRDEIELTAEQAVEVEAALVEWRQLAAASLNFEDVLLEDAPAVTFLAKVSATLSAEQMETLRSLVAAAVSARAAGLTPDPTDRGTTLHGGIRGLFRDLDLTEEQRIAIRDALESAREDAMELCARYRAHEISEQELRDGRAELRAELAAAIDAVLNEDQRAQLEENKLGILTRRLSALLAHYENRIKGRVASLDAMLELSAEQEVAITDVLLAVRPHLESLRTDAQGGAVTAAEAWESFHEIQEATRDAVVEELTEEQRAILDELREMYEPCAAPVDL